MKQNWQWTAVFVIGFRLFLQATLLERHCYSACWLVPIGGFLIALPVVWLVARNWQKIASAALPDSRFGAWIRVCAVLYLLVDTAQIVLLYQEGSKFASLSSYPTAVLYLLLILFALFVVRQNRNGVFGLGSAIKTALLLCMGALIVFRIPDISIVRLLPVLGGGAKQLLLSSLSAAGYAFSFLILLACAPSFAPRTGTIIGMWATACAGGTLFTAMETMISPISPGEPAGTYLAVSRMLASGRSQTTLQLVLYLAWFALLFIAVCVNLKCMTICASELARKPEKLYIQLIVLLAVMVLANVCEHTMGNQLAAFLNKPGAFRSLLLLPPLLLLLPQTPRRAVKT